MKRIILKLYRRTHFCLGDGNLLFLTSVEEKKKGNVYPIFQSYLLPRFPIGKKIRLHKQLEQRTGKHRKRNKQRAGTRGGRNIGEHCRVERKKALIQLRQWKKKNKEENKKEKYTNRRRNKKRKKLLIECEKNVREKKENNL
jgi:hypothetical protein